jgi:hypothetical protein
MTMTLDEVIEYCVDQHASCARERDAEMFLQIATWLGELQKIEQDGGPGQRAREAAQILIEEIGAPGPESCIETSKRAVAHIRRIQKELNEANATIELHYDAIEDDRMMGEW